ncbi:hypothetical protein DYB32_004688 [Aphanomyces invadans]|uniref:Guanylate cyclase domain-containing protein n=1 Tax=Aphanomyces invadans TaxID=157072 RepID=A0A3R6WM40_9STRA|nr:hypothetical protein DYB32_004688 [Aphanomyces invadans]
MNGRGDPYISSTGGPSHVLHKYAVSRHQADPRCREVYHPLPHTASGHTLLPVDVVMGHDVIMQGGGMGGQNTPMLRACDSTSSIDINVDDFDSSTVFVYVSVAAFQRLARQFQELMEEATSLYVHMIRSRLNEYGGVELRFNEGYFVVGFQTEFNAARWCLAMQLGLMYAAWNPRFLRAPEAQEEMSRHRPMPVFRGLRVRMAIHSACPNSESDDDDVDADSLLEFTEANPPEQDPRELVRLIGECVHGGQIALSDGVWEKLKEQLVQLGNPVVEDLGKHVVGGHALQLFQLLPKHLEDRHFLPLMSIKQLAPAMRDAPTAAGEVTMVFTFIEGARSLMLNDAHALVSRVKTICTLSRKLLRTHRGYECQELQGDFMLAFFRPADAIAWCGEVQKKVHALFSQDPSGIQFRISMGIETGVPVSVSPHKSSGRADYFGNIVNQTARIAKAAHGGQIMLGGDAWKAFMHDSASHSDRPLAGSLPFYFKDHGYFQFKGIASGTLLVEVVPFGLETIVHAATTAKVYKKPVPPSTVPLPDRNRLVYVWSQTGEGESDVGYSIRDTEVFDDKSLYGTLSEWTPQDLRTWFNEDSKRGVFDMPHAVCVVGNGNVGKTSLTTRYAKGRFTDNYKKTIGVDFMERVLSIDGDDIHLMIWDTAGQEEFDTLTSRYYRGAGAVVYVFSTVDRESFDALPSWQQKVLDACGSSICQVLVQNKVDLIDDAVMTKDEVNDMKDDMRVKLYRTSVQENKNVEEGLLCRGRFCMWLSHGPMSIAVFEYLCRRYLKKKVPENAAVADIGGAASPPTRKSKQKATSSRHTSQHDNDDDNFVRRPVAKAVATPKSDRFKNDNDDGLSFDDIRVALPANEDAIQRMDEVDEKDDPPTEHPASPHRPKDEHGYNRDPRWSDIPAAASPAMGGPIEPSKRRTNGKKKTGWAKLSYMHVPVDVDSLVVRGKLQQDRREANEARHMAWEDFFATQWGKAERDAAAKTQQRLQHQIDQLSKITVTSRHFELWNTAIDRHYYEYISYSLQDPTLRDTLLSNVHNGLTPLARACTTKDYALVRILLAHGADVTAKSPSSPNAYMRSIFCAAVADFRVFELLVEHLPTARELRGLDKDGLSLVHLAAQGGYVTALEALLKMPITSDLVDTTTSKHGYTALHYAVVGGHVDCVAVLLRYMSPSVAAAMTCDGCNALHLALRVDGTHFHLEQLVENFINAK